MQAPLLIFFAFLLYLYSGASAIQLNPSKRLNQVFAAACASYCLWSTAYILINALLTVRAGSLFYAVSSFGSVFFISFMLHFFFSLTRPRRRVRAALFLPAAYIPSAVFFIMGVTGAPGAEDFIMLSLDRAMITRGAPFLFWSYAVWYAAGTCACLLLTSSWKKHSTAPEERRQAQILLSAGAAALSLALLSTFILPFFNVKLPLLLLATSLTWVFGIWRVLALRRVITLKDVKVSENILNTMAEAIILTDPEGRIISANPAALELSGYGAEEVISLDAAKLLRGDGNIIESVRSGKTIKNINFRLRAKDGGEIPVLAYAAPIIDRNRKLEGISFILNDITELKKTEILLRKNEQKYRDLWENAPLSYHVLDVSGRIIDVNLTEARMFGYTREEMLGKEIFDFIEPGQRFEARTRFHEKIAGMPVPEVQKRNYLRKDGTHVFVSVHDAPQRDGSGKTTGIRTTMLDITKRVRAEEKLGETYRRLEQSLEQMVLVIAKIVELRDPYTAGHGRKVAQLACKIAEKLGFSEDRINGVHMASIIHDIGKIYVPVEILSKPSRLSEIEFDIVKNHTSTAYDILKDVDFPWPIARIIHQHHERINGSGYPLGIGGEEILREAKIIGIADVTESMVSFRPYRPALGIEKAMEEIAARRGILYDPQAADVCAELFKAGFSFEEDNHAQLTGPRQTAVRGIK